jgi:hypothetical protein
MGMMGSHKHSELTRYTPQRPYNVVSFGHELELLRSRTLVLARLYTARMVSRLGELRKELKDEPVDLIILCHTLSEEERRIVIEAASRKSPPKPVLLLVKDRNDRQVWRNSFVVGLGPAALLTTVASILHAEVPAVAPKRPQGHASLVL